MNETPIHDTEDLDFRMARTIRAVLEMTGEVPLRLAQIHRDVLSLEKRLEPSQKVGLRS